MDTTEINLNCQKLNIELLKVYYEEWKFRQEGLWKRMTAFFIIIFFVSTLPVTYFILGVQELPQVAAWIYPVCGLLLSVFYVFYCFAESHRINAVDILMKRIVETNFPSAYAKHGLQSFFESKNNEGKPPLKIFTWRMAIWVPILLSSFEIIIAISMIILIWTKVIVI